MLELVTGGSGSGKSAYAESRICELNQQEPAPLYYIATMYPYGEETQKKIERHRILRKGKGFDTLEWYTGMEEHLKEKSLRGANVLLECMSNFVANEMYVESGAGAQAEQAILEGIRQLNGQCANLVIVTNEVFSESVPDNAEMVEYKRILGGVNCEMAKLADQVTEVVYGVPLHKKERSARVKENSSDRRNGKEEQKQTDGVDMEHEIRLEEQMDEKDSALTIVIGGAFQGKTAYVKQICPELWKNHVDGAFCPLDAVQTCQSMNHFHTFVRRWLLEGRTKEQLLMKIQENPSLRLVVSDETGYGLVPIDAFEREYREAHGRIMTELAQRADHVVRVVCGIPQEL